MASRGALRYFFRALGDRPVFFCSDSCEFEVTKRREETYDGEIINLCDA